jgi:hypothetical protein
LKYLGGKKIVDDELSIAKGTRPEKLNDLFLLKQSGMQMPGTAQAFFIVI